MNNIYDTMCDEFASTSELLENLKEIFLQLFYLLSTFSTYYNNDDSIVMYAFSQLPIFAINA